MDLACAIAEFGGKAGQLYVLHEARIGLPIPGFVILSAGRSFSDVSSIVDGFRFPCIVRGSNPADHRGLEGIIPTYADLMSLQEVNAAVDRLAGFANRKENFSAYESVYGEVDHTTHALIMEQNSSDTFVNVLRHPNEPDLLQIEFVYKPRAGIDRTCFAFQYRQSTGRFYHGDLTEEYGLDEVLSQITGFGGVTKTPKMMDSLLRTILTVEKSGLVSQGYALELECAFDFPALFQVRPFKRFSKANPGLPGAAPKNNPYCIGITPPEGIRLLVCRDDDDFAKKCKARPESPSGYFKIMDGCDGSDLFVSSLIKINKFKDGQYLKLRAFGYHRPNSAVLSHDTVRLMKHCDVVCFNVPYPVSNKGEVHLTVNGAGYYLRYNFR